jgi:hypothetical protein
MCQILHKFRACRNLFQIFDTYSREGNNKFWVKLYLHHDVLINYAIARISIQIAWTIPIKIRLTWNIVNLFKSALDATCIKVNEQRGTKTYHLSTIAIACECSYKSEIMFELMNEMRLSNMVLGDRIALMISSLTSTNSQKLLHLQSLWFYDPSSKEIYFIEINIKSNFKAQFERETFHYDVTKVDVQTWPKANVSCAVNDFSLPTLTCQLCRIKIAWTNRHHSPILPPLLHVYLFTSLYAFTHCAKCKIHVQCLRYEILLHKQCMGRVGLMSVELLFYVYFNECKYFFSLAMLKFTFE